MVLFSIVLSFFCVLIFYCFNKRISVSPKPGMVYNVFKKVMEISTIVKKATSRKKAVKSLKLVKKRILP